jgi:hypothetical protein
MKKLTPKKTKEVSKDKIVNLNLYKIKKTLTEEGFEVIENNKGNLKLIIRVPEIID